MANPLDLQKLTLRRLLDSQNHELFTKLSNKYFLGPNLVLFGKIQNFYKANLRLPSREEFFLLKKDVATQDYLEGQILSEDNKNDKIRDEFLVSQLQDFFIREETIEFLDKFLENFENFEKVEIIEELQNHLLSLNKSIPISEECYDVAELDIIPKGDSFKLYSSGLSHEYDSVNGGLGLQELVLLGGRRGSGKSIVSLNLGKHRFQQNFTVAFFTIEMRYKEVHDRFVSMISSVPFLDLLKNQLTEGQKLQIAKAKMRYLYDLEDPLAHEYLKELEENKKFDDFEKKMKSKRPKFRDNRFFIIDDESLTLNRFDHYCNLFSSKYPNFNMAVVDYLNIVSIPESKDWKSQINIAEELKRISRKYDITVLSPYQIDQTGEARFAKGILDAADRSFIFFPNENDKGENNDILTLHTTKIRNGKKMNFDVFMNWECVSIDPRRSNLINERPHVGAVYGSDSSEAALDLS